MVWMSTLVAVVVLWYTSSFIMWIKTKYDIPPADQVLRNFGTPSSTVLASKVLEVLVWNIEKGVETDFANEFPQFASGKHLILLQEYLGNNSTHDVLQRQAQLRFDVATSFIYSADGTPSGVATASIVCPQHVRALVTSDVEPVIHTPKASILTQYPLQGKGGTIEILLVLNTHGLNRAPLEAFQTQLQQLAQIIRAHEGPVLWAGDFNTNNRRKRDYLFDVAVSELQMQAIPQYEPDQRKVSKLSRLPLDWVFFKRLAVKAASAPVSSGSDHNPLVLTFSHDTATDSIETK